LIRRAEDERRKEESTLSLELVAGDTHGDGEGEEKE